jgi:predicted ArsR family transcriptional regulator
VHKIDWSLLIYPPYKEDHEMLLDLYDNKDWSMEKIAEHLGVNKFTVKRRLVELEIPLKGRGGRRKEPQT